MGKRLTEDRLTLLLLWLVTCSLFFAGTGRVWAHGGGTPQLTSEQAGPYRVYAWTEPEPWRKGDVHISLAVTMPPPTDTVIDDNLVANQLEQPVKDADVLVRFTAIDTPGEAIAVAAVPQEFMNGYYYEVDTTLPTAGAWSVEVDVTGPDGRGTVDFAVDALTARTVNWWLIGGGIVGLLALLGVAGWRSRRNTPAPTRPTRRSQAR